MLESLRARIQHLDQQILALLAERLEIAEQIGRAKPPGSPRWRPAREAALLTSHAAAWTGPGSFQDGPAQVLRALMRASLGRQLAKPLRVAAPPEAAAQVGALFGRESWHPADSATAACAALLKGTVDLALLPSRALWPLQPPLRLAAVLSAGAAVLGLDSDLEPPPPKAPLWSLDEQDLLQPDPGPRSLGRAVLLSA